MKVESNVQMKHLKRRGQIQQDIPPYYNPYLFFGLTNLLGITAIYYSIGWVENLRPLEWLALPGVFILANFVEYQLHRGPMHSRWPRMDLVFRRHTLRHHEYFPHDQMGFETSREAYLVLFPFPMIFLVFGLALPLFLLTWSLTNRNVAGMFLIVAVGYFLLYEWMHLMYHLPEGSRISRSPWIQTLRLHHQIHHNKALMSRYNFNITFPIWDWILGTYYRAPSKKEIP